MLKKIQTIMISSVLTACAVTHDTETMRPLVHEGLYALAYMQTSEEYMALTLGTYQQIQTQLQPIVTRNKPVNKQASNQKIAASLSSFQESSALPKNERLNNDAGQPLAIIMDIDETVLDNSPYQARLMRDHKNYTESSWDAWCNERSAQSILGAVEFVKWANQQGVTVFFVSNRKIHLLEATADNLRQAGFLIPDDHRNVLLRDDGRGWSKEKGSRRQYIDQNYRVIALVGDNLGDFVDGIYQDHVMRQQQMEVYSNYWGRSWFMLPNPSYGSWVDILMKKCGGDDAAHSSSACVYKALRYE